MGGRAVLFEEGEALLGVGFLFPRGYRGHAREFTLRHHRHDTARTVDPAAAVLGVEGLLGGDRVIFYDPLLEQQYAPTSRQVMGVDVGSPSAREAGAIRRLQQEVWASDPDYLYPTDIHSLGFGAGTSLVGRIQGELAGFLFGFYKFGGPPLPETWEQKFGGSLRVESQLLGVLARHRRSGLGYILKRVQAERARREGIGVVNWTVDPLQFANAVLNFQRLKAVALDFYPNYHPFRNALNQVPASRLGITWLVQSERVQRALVAPAREPAVDLHGDRSVRRLNEGWARLELAADDPVVAIEVPADWTALQSASLEEALRWREATDRLFHHYLGGREGRYVITGAATDLERRFLIAHRVEPGLLEGLAA
jgi:predicted GNAT superfamily acetyltransferase